MLQSQVSSFGVAIELDVGGAAEQAVGVEVGPPAVAALVVDGVIGQAVGAEQVVGVEVGPPVAALVVGGVVGQAVGEGVGPLALAAVAEELELAAAASMKTDPAPQQGRWQCLSRTS